MTLRCPMFMTRLDGGGCGCSAGYEDISATDEPVDCSPCKVGYFKADVGNDKCVACAPGWHQPLEGASSCVACGASLLR